MVAVGERLVGDGEPPYVIAEIGANHNGDMALCRTLVDAAQQAGADAVKFQSWSKDSLISKAEYRRHPAYADPHRHCGSLETMVERYQFTADQHYEIARYCGERGITFLSSAFSPREIELLEDLGVVAHKVASMDVNHFILLERVAKTRKPVMLSTGMASLAEIDAAVSVLHENRSGPIILLHCVAVYPPRSETINLRNIQMLRQAFCRPVGFSDHSIGTAVPLAAIACGACVIEKHFTVDKALEGWDHAISANPEELAAIVRDGRLVHAALGTTERVLSPEEREKRRGARRRIVLRRPIRAGALLALDDLDFKRPGTGIHPNEAVYVVGRRVTHDLLADDELEWSDLA